MKEILDAVQNAFDLTNKIQVFGHEVEQMANLRQALRVVYALVKQKGGEMVDQH